MELETKDVVLIGLGAATGIFIVGKMQEEPEPLTSAGIILGSLVGAMGIDYLTKPFR